MSVTRKGVKENLNWIKPELLAVSEHVLVRGKYSNRNAMLRQLVMDKALELGVVDKREHELFSLMANDARRGEDYESGGES